jgi:hypothetical protein
MDCSAGQGVGFSTATTSRHRSRRPSSRAAAGRKHRDKEGWPVTYGDLLEKTDPGLAAMVAPENLVARQNVARAAVRHLRESVGRAALDALIVFGDDQNEGYREDCRSTFAI